MYSSLGRHSEARPFRMRWICQIDWFASFASLLGTDLPEGAAPDSENYLDTWLGKEAEGRPYLVEQNAQNNLSITSGEWKYIEPGKGEAIQ